MNFANNTLQMMKEMMFSREEMMKNAKYTLQNEEKRILQKPHHL